VAVRSFDHYNLCAPRAVLDELCAFYRDVVGLTPGWRPPFRRFGYWLYAGDRPVLHLNQANDDERFAAEPASTFSHAAFRCTGRSEYEKRLAEQTIEYRTARVPETGQTQLFFKDPAGNGIELSFDDEEG
jgi:catechol-2,3-dioxygenase